MQYLISLLAAALLAGCAVVPAPTCPLTQPCPACPACPPTEPAKPPEKPLQPADWSDLIGWQDDDQVAAFDAFLSSCGKIESQPSWTARPHAVPP